MTGQQAHPEAASRPRWRRAARLAAVACAAAIATTLSGCGYSSKPLYPISIRTVAVPIFDNQTFRQGWEFRLTEAVDKDLEQDTPYKLAPANRADSILTGKIVDIQENVLTSRFSTNLPQETQITLVVAFTWKDLRSGRILVQRNAFARAGTEVLQLNQRVQDAEQAAVERAARGIVDQLQRPWK